MWRRSRRQVLGQLLACSEEVLFVHDVVAIEHRPTAVPHKHHRHALGHTCTNEVACRRPPIIVQKTRRNTCVGTGIRKCPPPSAHRQSVSTKHRGAARILPALASGQHGGKRRRDRQNTTDTRLRPLGRQPNHTALPIDFAARELEDLTAPPPGVVREVQHVSERRWQAPPNGKVFMVLEEPLSWRALTQARRKRWGRRHPAKLERDVEHAAEGRGLPIDGCPGGSLLPPYDLILPNVGRGDVAGERRRVEERLEVLHAAASVHHAELPQVVILQVRCDQATEIYSAVFSYGRRLTNCVRGGSVHKRPPEGEGRYGQPTGPVPYALETVAGPARGSWRP